MNKVNVVDSVGDVIMVATFKEDHMLEMIKRGWIVSEDNSLSMSTDNLKRFVDEAAL